MKKLKMTGGFVTIVDDDVYEWASKRGWFAERHSNRTRIYAKDSKRNRLHRLIMKAGVGQQVDHRDGNGLNNRRDNLRLCDRRGNARNTDLRVNNESGFKGVYWYRRDSEWKAQIKIDGKVKHLGCYSDARDAAEAYDRAALSLFGEYAWTNFPKEYYL
jgi:hypothetical protein